MALAISGSNGGITKNQEKYSKQELQYFPLEVSYFVNNICNLSCKHCYVGYNKTDNSLELDEWKRIFDEFLSLGARTFGNVGKEPLLNWVKTKNILNYLKQKKIGIPNLRFGFVTNGILLDEEKIIELNEIMPDYVDISMDGNKEVHDFIRGKGTYDPLMANLQTLSKYSLKDKIFISFTLNRLNASCFGDMIKNVYALGIKNICLSIYVTLNKNDELYISDSDIVDSITKLLDEKIINFSDYKDLTIYIKNDFSTTRSLMEKMVDLNIIRKDELLIDDYNVIFDKYKFDTNVIYFNYMPFDTVLKIAFRLSHDGFISNCWDMFYENYPDRAIGNIREKSIIEILESADIRCAAMAI